MAEQSTIRFINLIGGVIPRRLYMKQTLYKVLGKNLRSPFQNFYYELNKKYHCKDFDRNPEHDCSRGFYATDFDGIMYSWRPHLAVFEVEVWGRKVEINEYKRRYSNIKIIKFIRKQELVSLANTWSSKVKYKMNEVIEPINPIEIENDLTDKDLENFYKWINLHSPSRDFQDKIEHAISNRYSYHIIEAAKASLSESIFNKILYPIRRMISDNNPDFSFRDEELYLSDFLHTYLVSLFPRSSLLYFIRDYEIDAIIAGMHLYRRGFVPSYSCGTWRLHRGPLAEIVARSYQNSDMEYTTDGGKIWKPRTI